MIDGVVESLAENDVEAGAVQVKGSGLDTGEIRRKFR